MPARVSTGDRDAVLRQIRWCAAVQTRYNGHMTELTDQKHNSSHHVLVLPSTPSSTADCEYKTTLHLLSVGPKCTRPACGSGYDRYRLRARAGAQQQIRQPPLLLSLDGTDRRTDRQTDGRTDTGPFYDARRILRSPARNKYASRGCSVKFLVPTW